MSYNLVKRKELKGRRILHWQILVDTGQTGSENNKGQQAGRGKNRNNGQNVNIADSSNVNTRFSFVDTCGYTASPYPVAMNFPQHGQLQPQPQQQTVANKSVGESVLVFNATPATGQNMNPNMNPTYSPNQVMSQPIFSMPQTQVQSVLVFNATPATGQNMNPNMNPTYSPNQVMSQPIFSMPQTQVQLDVGID